MATIWSVDINADNIKEWYFYKYGENLPDKGQRQSTDLFMFFDEETAYNCSVVLSLIQFHVP